MTMCDDLARSPRLSLAPMEADEDLVDKIRYWHGHVRDILRMPAKNHAQVKRDEIGKCDRFIFPELIKCADAFDELFRAPEILASVQFPLPLCWIELPLAPGKESGFFLEENENGRHAVLFIGKDPLPAASFDMSLSRRGDGYYGKVLNFMEMDLSEVFKFLLVALALLNSHKTVLTERIIARKRTAAERAFAFRRNQFMCGQFSHNRITMIVPETCEYRGKIVETTSLIGKRGHWVIGHWRLIEGRARPTYFTWVDGHESGDSQLGWVAKTRKVNVSAGTRRGFFVPQFKGVSGQRVAVAPLVAP